MIAQFDQEAKGQSLTREQGLDRLQHNGDPLARERAEAIDQDIDRAGRLARQRQAFADAGPVARVASFAQNFDATTLSQAWRDFEPAVPVTTEAFVIGGVALVVGWSLTHIVAWPIRRLLRDQANAKVLMSRATGIEPDAHALLTEAGVIVYDQ